MNELMQLSQIDWWQVIIAVVLALVVVKFLWSLADWFLFDKLKIETGKMRQQRKDRELLKVTAELAKTTAENLDKLQKRHTKDEEEFRNNLNNYMEESRKDRKALHDEMTKFSNNRVADRQQSMEIQKELIASQKDSDAKIENLTTLFINKEIDDMRFKILDFCSALSNGSRYNRESYDHILRTYEKYEKILEENNLENGLVEQSVKFIQESYYEGLKNGTVK